MDEYDDKKEKELKETLGVDINDFDLRRTAEYHWEQANSDEKWLYFGYDADRPERFKFGMTTKKLSTVERKTSNLEYEIAKAFKVREDVTPNQLATAEKTILDEFNRKYGRLPFPQTGKPSEWFEGPLKEAIKHAHQLLSTSIRVTQLYPSDCGDSPYIPAWENDPLLQELNGEHFDEVKRAPFKVKQPQPDRDPACDQIGGCGDACDCKLWG